jgi:hypothetical protein
MGLELDGCLICGSLCVALVICKREGKARALFHDWRCFLNCIFQDYFTVLTNEQHP